VHAVGGMAHQASRLVGVALPYTDFYTEPKNDELSDISASWRTGVGRLPRQDVKVERPTKLAPDWHERQPQNEKASRR
jgi:hypothetical protein